MVRDWTWETLTAGKDAAELQLIYRNIRLRSLDNKLATNVDITETFCSIIIPELDFMCTAGCHWLSPFSLGAAAEDITTY